MKVEEKALVGAFSVIVKTYCETDGALHSTTRDQEMLQSGAQRGPGRLQLTDRTPMLQTICQAVHLALRAVNKISPKFSQYLEKVPVLVKVNHR